MAKDPKIAAAVETVLKKGRAEIDKIKKLDALAEKEAANLTKVAAKKK